MSNYKTWTKATRAMTVFLVLLFVASTSWSQAPPLPPPSGHHHHGGPGGPGMIGFLGWEMGLEHGVITGSPFSAQFTSTTTQVLADGTTIQHQTSGTLARDSQGRTRREMTLPAIGPWATSGTPAQAVFLSDPVAGTRYVLDVNNKTVRQLPMRNKAANLAATPSTESPRLRAGNRIPATTESLGSQMIEGVSAQGTRTTRTLAIGAIGNDRPIQIVVETWYSAELHMNVMSKRTDPRFGTTTFHLTNVQRQEPNASLFQVPSEFTAQPARPTGPTPALPQKPSDQ